MGKRNLDEEMETLKRRNTIRKNINETLTNYNYENIEPSFFEKYDSFNQFHGRISKEKTVKVINNKGEIEILRPDITLNIIKKISRLWEENKEIKLCYDSTVFINDSNLGIVETRQIGAESLGDKSIECDIEILNIIKELLANLDKSALVIGNTKYLRSLLDEIDSSSEIKDEIIECVYKKNSGELIEIFKLIEIRTEIKEKILMLIRTDSFDRDKLYSGFNNEKMIEALSEIEYISTKINSSSNISISFDLGLVSEFDYYDGIIFKGFHPKINQCFIKGGRYDKLSNIFKKDIPAVGFSLDVNEYFKVIGGSND